MGDNISFKDVSDPVDGRVIQEVDEVGNPRLNRQVVSTGRDGWQRVDCACDGTDRAVRDCIANQDNENVSHAFGGRGERGYNYMAMIRECSNRAVARLMRDPGEE